MVYSIKGKQRTLGGEIGFSSIGTHTGEDIKVVLKPAEENFGIGFMKVGGQVMKVNHLVANAVMGCTIIGTAEDNIKTIEHFMATLNAMEIDNCLIEVSGGEMPIGDGSARDLVDMIKKVGIVEQSADRKVLRVLKKVEVEAENGVKACLEPATDFEGLEMDLVVNFPFCGEQRAVKKITPEVFEKEISFARTFAPMALVEQLKSQGLAKGASLKTGIAIENDGSILNPEGLRSADEFVLHKMLDSIGDMFVAGYHIIGKFTGVKCGHEINNQLIKKLMSDESNFVIE